MQPVFGCRVSMKQYLKSQKLQFKILNFLILKSKMLQRSGSGPLTPKIGVENMVTSLNQKDKIIYMLERELEGFVALRENYERLKDRKSQLFDKCQMLTRQISMTRANSDVRVDQSQKNIMDLKIMISGLEVELQNKQYLLKDLKFEAESLLKENDQRQNNLIHSGESMQHIRSSTQILKMESQRLSSQIAQYKEDLDRMKQYQYETESTREKIKNQILNTQTFLRQLSYEEGKLSENLAVIEDENNSIDDILCDLGKVSDLTKQKIREVKEEKQEIKMLIKAKELEKGRIQAEHLERQKQLKGEREKEKALREVSDAKKNESIRLKKFLKEVNDDSDQILKSNLEVEQINLQLQNDLAVCRKHLENVLKNNTSVKQQLELYHKTNMLAIKKLKKPIDEGWIDLGIGNGSSSRKRDIEDYQTGEGFDKTNC